MNEKYELKEYGKGYSYGNLNYMCKFASTFNKDEILEQLARLMKLAPKLGSKFHGEQ